MTLPADSQGVPRTPAQHDPRSPEVLPAAGEGSRWPVAVLVLLALLQLGLVFRVNFNWDEFAYLGRIYEYLRDEPTSTWQRFHVHLFGWLTRIPGDEISQLIAGRLASFAAEVATLALAYRLGRRFLSRRHAAFGVAAVLSSEYVLRHGFSFRPDPFCLALFLAAANLLLAERRLGLAAALAGAAGALALMLTLKSIFLLAALVGLIATRWIRRPRVEARRALAFLLSALVVGTALYLYHRASLPPASTDPMVHSDLPGTANAMLLPEHLFPRWQYLAASLQQSMLVWIAVLAGLAMAIFGWRRGREEALLLPLAFPLATLVFYRNAWPYYYALVLVPLAGFAGLSLARLKAWVGSSRLRALRVLPGVLWCGIAITYSTHFLGHVADETLAQRQLVQAVHHLFPEPVRYLDRCSMIGSFPKVGFFMSTLGVQRYWELRRPVMAELLRTKAPVFLLANSEGLELDVPEELARRSLFALRPEDRQVLRQNFVRHWGSLWLAGKTLRLDATGATDFEILVGGPYTVEAAAPMRVDEQLVGPGAVVKLVPGSHCADQGRCGEVVILRWGDHLPRPAQPPVRQPLFTLF